MGLSFYEALGDGVHRPDILLKQTLFGLGDYYRYLDRARRNLRDRELRLAWKRAEKPEDWENGGDGCWIELVEREDAPNEPERTFQAFLDESISYLEPDPITQGQSPAQSANRRRRRRRIDVLDRDPSSYLLQLSEEPPEDHLLALPPNTYVLDQQIRAIRSLQDTPAPEHAPLLRLFESTDQAIRKWAAFTPESKGMVWRFLVQEGETEPLESSDYGWLSTWDDQATSLRLGTEAQRQFVHQALSTPDFAFLEGPPGSGKTTAICELILQLIACGKRILLCASTHVAVDNVLERLMAEDSPGREEVIPVRIGDRRNVSMGARPYGLEEFCGTEKRRIAGFMNASRPLSPAREEWLRIIEADNETLQRMILEAANLVCGTTIGILQHPAIKAARKESNIVTPEFDYLILDEASKTTFHEFLVPALHAKRWVIVGDSKQLSPYVEDEDLAASIRDVFPDEELNQAALDLYLAGNPRKPAPFLVVTDEQKLRTSYLSEAEARGLLCADESTDIDSSEFAAAHAVVCRPGSLEELTDRLPLDLVVCRGECHLPERLGRRLFSASKRSGYRADLKWENEVAWRTARSFEKRFASADHNHRWREVESLLPKSLNGNRDSVIESFRALRRVALPSVLELLQHGFEKRARQKKENTLSEGLPTRVFKQRHTLLEYQHRMHPDIAEFSAEHIYDGQALKNPPDMTFMRNWSYSPQRAKWSQISGTFDRKHMSNKHEATAILRELQCFASWARQNPKPGPSGSPWDVAILTFYRGQERLLRELLRRETRDYRARRHFKLSNVDIQLCTVDRFQGHEADVVYLSIASDFPTDFFDSPNRLNVALTRARYQRIIFGDRNKLQRSKGPKADSIFQHLLRWHNKRTDLGYGGTQ